MKRLDLTGQRIGRLIILNPTKYRTSSLQIKWRCKCDCGKETLVSGSYLKSGHIKSCGCLRKDTWNNYKHGDARRGKQTRLNRIWVLIKKRCYDSKSSNYKWYGAKGILVCDEWKYAFIPFKKWALKNGYRDDLTIDRINPKGNYIPENCRWITQSENSRRK